MLDESGGWTPLGSPALPPEESWTALDVASAPEVTVGPSVFERLPPPLSFDEAEALVQMPAMPIGPDEKPVLIFGDETVAQKRESPATAVPSDYEATEAGQVGDASPSPSMAGNPATTPPIGRIHTPLPKAPSYATGQGGAEQVEPFTASLTAPPAPASDAPATAAFRASSRPDQQPAASPAATALHLQGLAWMNGDGVTVNKQQAVTCFTNAANLAYAPAMFALGRCYEKGEGVPPDKQLALMWYRRAADLGDPQAQHQLAAHLTYGWGVKRDLTAAIHWYLLSAAQGYAPAQYQIGECYAKGWGVKPDQTQAMAWWEKAAAQGHQDAQDSLKKIRR